MRAASVEPRIFGVIPPLLALLLGLAGIVLGAILVVTGRWPVGIAAFAIGALLGALAIDAARRWPTSALPRAVVKVVDRLSAGAGLARVSAGAFSGASREVIQLRRELRRMRRQRDQEQHALGAAALEENDEETAALKERIRELDRRTEDAERRIVEVRGAARDRVARERAAIRPTQAFAVAEDAPEANAEADDAVTGPTEVKPLVVECRRRHFRPRCLSPAAVRLFSLFPQRFATEAGIGVRTDGRHETGASTAPRGTVSVGAWLGASAKESWSPGATGSSGSSAPAAWPQSGLRATSASGGQWR